MDTLYIPPAINERNNMNIFECHVYAIRSIAYNVNGMLLITGDFDLTGITWVKDGSKSNYIAIGSTCANSKLICDSMAQENLRHLNHLRNPFGNILDLCFCNETNSLHLTESTNPLSKVDPAHRPFLVQI